MSRFQGIMLIAALICTASFVYLQSAEGRNKIDPHQNSCGNCHNLHGGYADPIPGSKLFTGTTAEATCLSCHGPAGISNIIVEVHDNKPGSTYSAFSMTCTRCHDPHVYPDNWRVGENLMMIGTTYNNSNDGSGLGTVNTPLNGIANVVYESRGTDVGNSFYNSFADNDFNGDAVYDGVCEACHTQTKYHRNSSAGDHAHNTGTTCTKCHGHDKGFSEPVGECIDCHNQTQGIFRQVYGAGGDFSSYTSRHIFGGNATSWDCIVCHAEGSISSGGANVVTTSEHNDAESTIALRNVDNVPSFAGEPGTGVGPDATALNPNFWRWPTPSNTPTEADHRNMDLFCMGCHDSDGASMIAVNSTDDGLDLTAVTANALSPFNSSDAIDAGTGGGTNTPGATLTTWFGDQSSCEGKGFTWDGSDCNDTRSRVLDVKSQFDTANPSHHAVRGQRYTSIHSGECDAADDKSYNSSVECTSAGYTWTTTSRCITTHTTEAGCTGAGFVWGQWVEGAWINATLVNGTGLFSGRETARLHCADCHSVDANAHGSANGFMLQAASIDGTCGLCHNITTTYSDTATNVEYSRHDHTDDSNHTMDATRGSLLGEYDGYPGSVCLLCHGGAHYDGYGAIHGIPASPLDIRTNLSRYRFTGGSTMSRNITSPSDDWDIGGASASCYFADPDPQPWSKCQHHSLGGATTVDTQYGRGTSY